MKNRILACLLALCMTAAMLTGCGSSNDSESSNDTAGTEAEEEQEDGETGDPSVQLSAVDYPLETEYVYKDFNEHSLADVPRQGVETFENDEVVFQDITYEQMINMFQKEGNYLFVLNGSWCHNSRAMAPYLNEYAKEYGVDTIYAYDFDLDNNDNGNTFVRMTNGSENAGVNFNYMYGEVVEQYLTNIDDWIEYPSSSEAAITFTNSKGEDVTTSRIQQPILFLYNKDNTVDNSESGNGSTKCPVVYAFEKMVDRDEEGVYVKEQDEEGNDVTDEDGNPVRKYITDEYKAELKKIFDFMKDNNVELSEYTDDEYFRSAYPSLADAEKINLQVVTYRQFGWLLRQSGNALYMVGGAYDEATQNNIAKVNDYAVANDVKVYLFDPAVDGRISEDVWGYKNSGDIMTTGSVISFMYTDLIEESLTNLTTNEFDESNDDTCVVYENAAGQETKVPKLPLSYIFAYNKDATDEDGLPAPVVAYSENGENIFSVFEGYAAGAGVEAKDVQ